MMKKMLNGEAVLVKGLTKKDRSGKYDALLSLVKGEGNDKRIHWKIDFRNVSRWAPAPLARREISSRASMASAVPDGKMILLAIL